MNSKIHAVSNANEAVTAFRAHLRDQSNDADKTEVRFGYDRELTPHEREEIQSLGCQLIRQLSDKDAAKFVKRARLILDPS